MNVDEGDDNSYSKDGSSRGGGGGGEGKRGSTNEEGRRDSRGSGGGKRGSASEEGRRDSRGGGGGGGAKRGSIGEGKSKLYTDGRRMSSPFPSQPDGNRRTSWRTVVRQFFLVFYLSIFISLKLTHIFIFSCQFNFQFLLDFTHLKK